MGRRHRERREFHLRTGRAVHYHGYWVHMTCCCRTAGIGNGCGGSSERASERFNPSRSEPDVRIWPAFKRLSIARISNLEFDSTCLLLTYNISKSVTIFGYKDIHTCRHVCTCMQAKEPEAAELGTNSTVHVCMTARALAAHYSLYPHDSCCIFCCRPAAARNATLPLTELYRSACMGAETTLLPEVN